MAFEIVFKRFFKTLAMQYKFQNRNLDFLKEKIQEINTALSGSELNGELQIPNNIIQTLTAENDGTLWFFTSCNSKQIKNSDGAFYANLNYQKKGTGSRLQLSGIASVVKNNNEDLFYNYPKNSYGKLVLIKMKIMHAEFIEKKISEKNSWTEKIKYTFNNLFYGSRTQDLQFLRIIDI